MCFDLSITRTVKNLGNYRIPLSAPATVDAIKRTIMPITKIFLVEDFIDRILLSIGILALWIQNINFGV
jgi:hypothetical protein